MIKRLIIGNEFKDYKKGIDIFCSVYRNNILEKYYCESFNKYDLRIFDIDIEEKIENNNKILFIIDNILRSYIENILSKKDIYLNKNDFKFFYSDAIVRLTNLLWFAFCFVKKISNKYIDEELIISLPQYKKKLFDKPKYSSELAYLLSNDDFIDYIVSKCFSEFAPSNWKIIYRENFIQKINFNKLSHRNLLVRFILGLGRFSHEEFNWLTSLLMGLCFSLKRIKRIKRIKKIKKIKVKKILNVL